MSRTCCRALAVILPCVIIIAPLPAQIERPTFEQPNQGEVEPENGWPSHVYARPISRETVNDYFFWRVPEDQFEWPAQCDALLDEYESAYTDLAMQFHDENIEYERKRDERFKQGIHDDPAFVRDQLLQTLDHQQQLERMDHRFLQDFADSLAQHHIELRFSVQSAFDRRARMIFRAEMGSASNHELLIDFWKLAKECEPLAGLYERNPAFIENYSRDYAEAVRKKHDSALKILPQLAEAARAGNALSDVGAKLEREQAALKEAIEEVNRQYYTQAMAQLSDGDAYALHRLYYSTAFPKKFKRNDAIELLCTASLILPGLSTEQRDELNSRLGLYRRTVIEKEQEYLYLSTDGRREMLARMSDDVESGELKKQLTRFRDRLETIVSDIASERAAQEEAWQDILTPAQQEAVRDRLNENN